jgi:hypothetical protein
MITNKSCSVVCLKTKGKNKPMVLGCSEVKNFCEDLSANFNVICRLKQQFLSADARHFYDYVKLYFRE